MYVELLVFSQYMRKGQQGVKGNIWTPQWRSIRRLEQPHNLNCSKDAIKTIGSSLSKWWGHLMQDILKNLWSENSKGRYHLEDCGVNGRIILKPISKRIKDLL